MIEPTLNPYAPPLAQVADAPPNAVAERKLFSAKGRIGRLRYLAYVTAASVLHNLISSVVTLVIMRVVSVSALASIGQLMYVVFLWFVVIAGIKRCHDMGISGWWSLTLIFPVIVLAWVFWPGSRDANRFGPPPPPNTWGVRILGLLLPIISLVGMLAAIAIPQYKHYTDRARAAQAANPH